MNEELILLIIYSAYIAIPNREYFFLLIYSILIISNITKIIKLCLFTKIKIKTRIYLFINYIIIYIFSYFFIKDPNPFYNICTFYLPLPNYFKGIFIIIFTTFFLNNKVFNINIEEPILNKSENNQENEEKNKNNKNSKYEPFFLFILLQKNPH